MNVPRPVPAWAAAWGLAGFGLLASDAFSTPSTRPAVVGVLAGSVGWSVGGAATARLWAAGRCDATVKGAILWGAAYSLAFPLSAALGDWFERSTVGGVSSAGFVGHLLGWSAAAAVASGATAIVAHGPRAPSLLPAALAWAGAVLAAGFLALILAIIGGELASSVLGDSLGEHTALALGWTAGYAIAGAVAAVATQRVLRTENSELITHNS